MYKETRSKVKDILKNVTNVGVQLDHYTSSQHYPYANVCVSYIDSDFNMHNISLGTFPYKDGHTSEQIFSSMEGDKGIIRKFLPSNPHRIYTTDNTNAMISAFHKKPNIAWFGCFAHVIHLMVKAGLSITEVSQLLA